MQVPLAADLDAVVAGLREEAASRARGLRLRQRARRHGDRDDSRRRRQRGRREAARAATCVSARTAGCGRWASGNDHRRPRRIAVAGRRPTRVARLLPPPPPHACAEAPEPPATCARSSSSALPVACSSLQRSRARRCTGRAATSSKLPPVAVGENSFIYAADGSRARRDSGRAKPRPRSRPREISPWMAKATVAIEDRRFYEHGGVDPDRHRPRGRRRREAPARSSRAVRRSHRSSCATSTLSRERTLKRKLDRGVPRDQARERLVEAAGSSPPI